MQPPRPDPESARTAHRSRSPRAARVCAWILVCAAGAGAARALPGWDGIQRTARPTPAPPEQRDAASVQAAFLYNFAARHVKWPESAHKEARSPFVLGVLGRDEIQTPLEATCKGRKSGDHPIEVRVLDGPESAASCHLVFVPADRESQLAAVVQACKGRPILIVGESEAAASRGAHVGFFLERAKVRFAIDPELSKAAGLEISSELLKLARIVDKHAGGGR